jgi:hypothetical protein
VQGMKESGCAIQERGCAMKEKECALSSAPYKTVRDTKDHGQLQQHLCTPWGCLARDVVTANSATGAAAAGSLKANTPAGMRKHLR